MTENSDEISGAETIVEADETYIGGVALGMGAGYKANKTVVLGMLQQDGDVGTEVVKSRSGRALLPHVSKHVKAGTEVRTDAFGGYGHLVIKGCKNRRVNHSAGQYVIPQGVGVNSIEGFWAQLKRTISGTHVHVSCKHLWKYAKEAEYRINRRNRPETTFDELVQTFAPLPLQGPIEKGFTAFHIGVIGNELI